MEAPLFNLIIFSVVAVFIALLFWPRLGLFQTIRGRLLMSKRIQLEDALKFILNTTAEDDAVTIASLSTGLNMTPAKAKELGEHMSRAGMIKIIDGRILLTKEGKQYALQIVRAHRLLERYLAEETSLEPKEWHTRAEEYEHRISPEEIESLADQLGDPLYDPHGDPIPTADGEYQPKKLIDLTGLPIGKCARVMHLEDEPEYIYDQLIALGIYLGMEFTLTEKSGDNYIIEADGRTLEVSQEAAGNLSVEQIENVEKVNGICAGESLDELKVGESAKIIKISPMCRGYERRRLMDLGLVPDTTIQFYQDGLSGGLKAFSVRGTVLALRNEQIKMISISDRKREQA